MERYSFGTLVTVTEQGPSVSHLTFLLDRTRGLHGTVCGHLARANPQSEHLEGGAEVLAVFTGPHAYVSPSWYAERPENVPTWNYAVVHARGTAQLIAPGRPTLEVLKRITDTYEPKVAGHYRVDLDDALLEQVSQGVVAFDIQIRELVGKFKLSQTRPEDDRINVRTQLAQSEDPLARELAALMPP